MTKKNNKKPNKKKTLKNREKSMREKSNANLIPFKKGESGNLKGRPPNISSIPHNIREVGKELITISITTIDEKGKKVKERVTTTKAKAIVYRIYAMAIAGNEKAAKLLWEIEIGKPAQTIALGLVEGENVNVIFRGADFLVEDDEGSYGEVAEDAKFTETDSDGDNGQAE